MAVCKYPERILPKKGWRGNISCKDILKSCNEAVVARRIDGNIEDCVDNTLGDNLRTLKVSALPYNRIPNLSTCLLGAKFNVEDFYFIQKADGKLDWNEDEEIEFLY